MRFINLKNASRPPKLVVTLSVVLRVLAEKKSLLKRLGNTTYTNIAQ